MRFLKKINWKSSLLYFFLIQVEILVACFFLLLPVIPLVRMIFVEKGIVRDIAEIVALLVVELLVRFLIYLPNFSNNRKLTFKQFNIDYFPSVILRLLISLPFSFAGYIASLTVSSTGIIIARYGIDKNIMTMQQVPAYIYIIVFVLYEALSLLIAFFAYKISLLIRMKTKNKLISNTEKQA